MDDLPSSSLFKLRLLATIEVYMSSEKLFVVPAYGKLYNTVKEAVEDWTNGKDFRAYPGGFYISKRDIVSAKTQFNSCYLKLPNLGIKIQIF